ncbi:hypothetical protein Rwratislav_12393 [Rhodococcus wratislaviensis IFP 2016]|nr:hypothetical protein Rwratislav_12393 [Rhodococcus wratislaviensis IFP 2016]
MGVYRILWWVVTVPLGLVGFAVAIFTVHPDVLVSAAFAAAVTGGGLTAMVADSSATATATPRSSLPTAALNAATAGAILISIVGLIALSGAAAVPLVLVLTVTARPVARRLRRWPPLAQLLTPKPSASCDPDVLTAPGSLPAPPPACAELSDDALCRGWRTSFAKLQNTASVTDRLRLARIRQQYLDEIERRDPQGFAAWFTTGARAGSDPSKFLTTREPPPTDRQ